MGSEKQFDLQERLIDFAVKVIKVTEALPNNRTGNHIRGQLLRCGTSTAANY
jgi:four helix bundle protein